MIPNCEPVPASACPWGHQPEECPPSLPLGQVGTHGDTRFRRPFVSRLFGEPRTRMSCGPGSDNLEAMVPLSELPRGELDEHSYPTNFRRRS